MYCGESVKIHVFLLTMNYSILYILRVTLIVLVNNKSFNVFNVNLLLQLFYIKIIDNT